MLKLNIEAIEDCLESTNQDISDLVRRSNTNTTKTYNKIVNTTKEMESVKKKITILGDMLTDLMVLNGSTKNQRILTELPVISSKGISILDGTLSLARNNETLIEFSNKDCVIISSKPIQIKDESLKNIEMESVFKYPQVKSISVSSVGYSYEFILKFPRLSKINNLSITLPGNARSYPLIESISYSAGTSLQAVRILNNNLYEYNLDDNRTIGNIYKVDIETVYTDELRFTLSSKTDSILDLVKIESYSHTYETEGEIVLGPLVTSDPILKIGISASDLSDNVTLAISTDNSQWIPLLDSTRIDTTSIDKIISFNTISEASFKTTEDIRRLYIKVILKSEEVPTEQEQAFYEGYREDGMLTDNVIPKVEPSKLTAYRMSRYNFELGKDNYFSFINLTNDLARKVEYFYEGGLPKVFGFNSTQYSVSDKDGGLHSSNLKLKPKRLEASSYIDAREFDPINAKIFDISLAPVKESINTLKSENLVLSLKGKEDTYRLQSQKAKQNISVDIDRAFVQSFTEHLYEVPYDDIDLIDSLGNIIHTFKKSDLTHINFTYFVNLCEILYNLPTVEGYDPNFLYPFITLKENEYALVDGKIHVGKGSLITFEGFKMIKTPVDFLPHLSYENGNTLERTTPLYTYHKVQVESQSLEVNTIKLANKSIEKGSVVIYDYKEIASLKEEPDTYIAVHHYVPSEYLSEDTTTLIKE